MQKEKNYLTKKISKKGENAGITLIALIITVIILLILAGTAISIAINGGDIFSRTSQARENWNGAVAEENTVMSNYIEYINEYAGIQNEEDIENDWIVAWTYDGTNWSEPRSPGTTLSGRIIAKIYETDSMIDVWSDTANDEVETSGLYLEITGQGDMGALSFYDETEDEDYNYAWTDYDLGDGVYYPKRIIQATVSNGITSIGDFAFDNTSISSFTINNDIENIGYEAFSNCEKLTSITIPSSVESIGECAFMNCSTLANVSLTNNITTIGASAFSGTAISSFFIPQDITRIEYGTFKDCSNLSSVIIPSTVTHIGNLAFSECENLTNLDIPNTVGTIKDLAFYNVPHITYSGTATGSPWGAKSIN